MSLLNVTWIEQNFCGVVELPNPCIEASSERSCKATTFALLAQHFQTLNCSSLRGLV
jgi:hypothetical protein